MWNAVSYAVINPGCGYEKKLLAIAQNEWSAEEYSTQSEISLSHPKVSYT